MGQSQEYLKREFVHYITNTLNLLGANENLINKLREIEEKPFTSEILDEIRRYNYDLLTDLRNRLDRCPTTTVFL